MDPSVRQGCSSDGDRREEGRDWNDGDERDQAGTCQEAEKEQSEGEVKG
jgi:hypothetical protein